MRDGSAPLRDAWYYAAPSRRLRQGRLFARRLLGEPVLLGRDRGGAVFALRDVCPHRGMPLSAGRFDGCEIECCYHGWRFAADGRCTVIPSLAAGQEFDLSGAAVPRYPVREVQGNIWVFVAGETGTAGDVPEIPLIDGFTDNAAPRLVETVRFRAAVDHAVIGLMDPAHGPFVHAAWWWRSRRSAHEKTKTFGPAPFGFTMLRHRPSRNSRAYRLLGGVPETEIAFRLPGVRVEQIRTGDRLVANLTALTPIDDTTTEVNHCIYWTSPLLSALKPALRPFVRAFLRQDREIMERQQQGLRDQPVLSLVGDADMQARWYYRLKEEYRRSREEGRPFANPVKPQTLRWRS